MELLLGLAVIAAVIYFVFFRKKEETASVSVADVAAQAEVVVTPKPAKKVAAKKPAAKKAPAKKTAAKKPKAK